MIAPTFYGQVNNGQLFINNRRQFDLYIGSLTGRVSIRVTRFRKKRTSGKPDENSNQNGYLWGVVYPHISEHTGFTVDEVHRAIGLKFYRIGGTDDFPKIQSTADYSKNEWEFKMEEIRSWALSELGINIPTVEDYYNEIENQNKNQNYEN